ncbi:MAG: methionyl-tRNA formyltransferase, partial [Planctomycetes bacterium]|nr:methionyl-tRNA formyltransferase [Planctomycetota bacterium]
MKILFAGSSEFAVPALRAIIADKAARPNVPMLHRGGQAANPDNRDKSNQLLGVITQPDSRKGRGLQETISPVKAEALKQGVKVYQPASINDADFIKVLQGLKPEIMVVAAYGQKLSNAVLSLPPKGCINIHPSILPKYRGAAPINYALWNGDNQTGVTVFQITSKMDAGPILSCCRTDIGADENAVELGNRLAELGAGLLAETLVRIRDNKIDLQEQSGPATCAPKLAKNDGKIIWTQAAQKIYWQYKAMQ